MDDQVNAISRELDHVHLILCEGAAIIVSHLRQGTEELRSVSAEIGKLSPTWAEVAAKRLLDAIQAAQLDRHDREAKILLGLPERNVTAVREWLKGMRLGESNSDALIAASRYGLAHIRSLKAASEDVGVGLRETNEPLAKAYADRIGELWKQLEATLLDQYQKFVVE
jgi:hypothetical protein